MLEAARVAAPRTIATAVLLHSLYGRARLADVTRQGVADAKTMGAAHRSKLLLRIGSAGGAALSKSEILQALLGAAGSSVGGLLTEEDIVEALPGDASLSPSATFGDARMYRIPWGSQVSQAKVTTDDAPTTEVITAAST